MERTWLRATMIRERNVIAYNRWGSTEAEFDTSLGLVTLKGRNLSSIIFESLKEYGISF